MADPSRSELPDGSGSRQRPSGLLETYVSDPQSPRPDEVQRLVSALEARQIELEAQNQQLREAQEQLQQSRAFLQTVTDAMPDAMFVIDRDYRIVLANRAALAAAQGVDPLDARLLCYQVVHDCETSHGGPQELCPLRQVMASKTPLSVTQTRLDAHGHEVFVDVRASPVLNQAGEVTHVVELRRDITERKRREQRAARLAALKAQLLGTSALDQQLKLITDAVVEVFDADCASIWILGEGDLCEKGCRHAAVATGPEVCRDQSRCLHLMASSGRYPALDGNHRRIPLGCSKIGRIASGEETAFVSNDVAHDLRVDDRQWAASLGLASFAGYRLLAPEGTPLGVLALFSKRQIDADENISLEDLSGSGVQAILAGQAHELLRQEKMFADTVIDSISGVFYVLDNQGRFVRWNRLLEAVTGIPGETLRGSDALRVIFPDDRQLAAGKIREVFEKGMAETEARILAKDGVREFWFTGRRMEIGPLSYLVGNGIDITDRKRMEEEIRRARDELEIRVQERTAELAQANVELSRAKDGAEAASRAKSTFLANMSHEIRTPLNAVIGMTELVLTSQLSLQQREFLQMVRDSGNVLLSVISDILDFSKIEAGKLTLDARAFDLRESLGNTLKSFAAAAREHGLKLSCVIHPEVPRTLLGDYNRLRQIIVNLMGNAIKFTERGEVRLEVQQECHSEKDVVLHFVVADSGIGIPPEKQSAIFEMFEQADASTTRRHGGTGLGLAIVSRLVDLMNGRIWVESEVGRGSRFHFVIRLNSAETVPADPTPPEPPSLRSLRVLVVEDSLVNQKLAAGLLEGQGHKVTVVSNGRAALDALETETFDLVLMDVQMPEMDGLEATQIIRTREQHTGAHIPIVAMTAHAMKGDREQCLATGMDGYVAKPIHFGELIGVMASLFATD